MIHDYLNYLIRERGFKLSTHITINTLWDQSVVATFTGIMKACNATIHVQQEAWIHHLYTKHAVWPDIGDICQWFIISLTSTENTSLLQWQCPFFLFLWFYGCSHCNDIVNSTSPNIVKVPFTISQWPFSLILC